MGKKKRDTMELRFYEVPQNEPVLALLGENWIRNYGHDAKNLHFHNLMEIGYCRNGVGKLILNETEYAYQSAMASVIPQNFPHTTINSQADGVSYWEFLFFDAMQLIAELYPKDEIYQREIGQLVSRRAFFFHEWENRNLILLIKMIMEEMREKKGHYKEYVHSLLLTLMIEIIRSGEKEAAECDSTYRKNGMLQISEALDYVRNEYAKPIKIEALAKLCHMSETHFRRIFENDMGMSPTEYINLIRVQKACDLMITTNDSMDEVAQKSGFSTTSTFNRNFKRYFNTSPYQWKIKPENYETRLLECNIAVRKGWN